MKAHKISGLMRLLCVALALIPVVACAPKSHVSTGQGGPEIVDADAGHERIQTLDPALTQAPPKDYKLTQKDHEILNRKSGLVFDMDVVETEEVQLYYAFFTSRFRDNFENWLHRSEVYLPYVRQVLTRYGLPQDLALLPYAESGYNPWAYSSAGAAGLWQFMPFTGRKFGLRVDWWIDERRDPYLSTEAAAKYLSKLYEMFGDWYLALAAYNAGEGKISRALEQSGAEDFFELTDKNENLPWRNQLRKETKHYVPKFLAISKIVQSLPELGFKPIDWNSSPKVEHIEIPGGTDLLALAKSLGMSWSEFHQMNPAFRRQISPPDGSSMIHVPAAQQPQVMAYLAKPGASPYAGYARYKIRKGDTWARLSSRYGVPVPVLKAVNRSPNSLTVGEYVMIPGEGPSMAAADKAATDIDSFKNGREKPAFKSKGKKDAEPDGQDNVRRYANQRANYAVRKGDTMFSIAQKFGVSVNTLQRANGLHAPSLRTGQRLYIPDATAEETRQTRSKADEVKKQVVEETNSRGKGATKVAQQVKHQVQPGETVWSIARKFKVNPVTLMEKNNLNRSSKLKPGDEIKVYLE